MQIILHLLLFKTPQRLFRIKFKIASTYKAMCIWFLATSPSSFSVTFFLCCRGGLLSLSPTQQASSDCSISFLPSCCMDHPLGHWNLYLNVTSQSPFLTTLNSIPCVFAIFHFTSLNYLTLYDIVIIFQVFPVKNKLFEGRKFLGNC